MHALFAVTLAACVLPLARAQALPDETLQRDLQFASKRTVADAERIVAQLAQVGSELRLVAVLPGLEHRFGCFADLDGDGDLDYVATEHHASREAVRVHRSDQSGWRTGASRSRGIDGTNPLVPWVLDDDGSGRRAILLPVARPPYLFLLPLNKNGDPVGRPIPLGDHLPRRLSRPRGVENVPYAITGVTAGSGDVAARVTGRMIDENGRARQDLEFELQLRDGAVFADARQVPPGPEPVDLIQPLAFPLSAARCEHESAERQAMIGSELRDTNDDGIDDMVLFSGVLSAHVFPGRIEDGRLVFGRELGRGRAVPIADLRAWFPVRLETVNEEQRFATAAREVINDLGFTVRRAGRYDAPFTLHTVASKGWLLHYYFAGATLVPVMDYRSAWPHTEGVHPLDECYREQVLIDADHDRTPDVLSVHVGQPFEWLRPPPPERAPTPDKHRRDVEHGRLRAGIVHGLGERGGGANRVLVQFDEPVKLDRRPERDAPISVHEVPVFGRDPGRVRYCVYFRPRRVGFFFEVASIAAEAQHARRFEAWRRRGERRLEMFPHYAACDQEVCEHDIPHDLEVCHDAAELFRRALPFAADAPQKARIWRDVARCHVAAGEIDEARRAYERFVMTGRRIEPLQPPPPQLAALFADEAFRALHRGWSQRLPVVPTDKL